MTYKTSLDLEYSRPVALSRILSGGSDCGSLPFGSLTLIKYCSRCLDTRFFELSKGRRKAKRPCSGDSLSVGDGGYLIGAAAGAIQQIVRS
ncbi:MAG: hypothetical protein VXZ29_07085, partial [Pseudomonadota bacterium]|nr:hypothetical protein [Pseudomonadota bacterium]